MNKLTFLKKLEIYTKLVVPFLPGILILMSIFMVLSDQSSKEFIDAAWILFFVGLFLVIRKLILAIRYIKMVEYGKRLEATLIDIIKPPEDSTNKIAYHFEYIIDNENYYFITKSIYMSDFFIGSKTTIFYLKNNPSNIFIPATSAINLH